MSIEDQRVRYGTDRLVFGVTAIAIVGFIMWGVLGTDSLTTASDAALTWVVTNTGVCSTSWPSSPWCS
ncbi:MAG: hypothetical protein ACR2FV_15590 [Ornithinimicrobium sp.]|uniref:hypothetical protein n=1 Tax=Ornithinimicrobium sp. TaxID=1977084 RepID=UPI003D9BF938